MPDPNQGQQQRTWRKYPFAMLSERKTATSKACQGYTLTVGPDAVKNTHCSRTDGGFMQCPALMREVHSAAGALLWAQATAESL